MELYFNFYVFLYMPHVYCRSDQFMLVWPRKFLNCHHGRVSWAAIALFHLHIYAG